MKKQSLLKIFPETEYPTEYLISRLKGRKSRFITKWEIILESPEPSSKLSSENKSKNIQDVFFDKEMYWIYSQMNKKLKKTFHSIFFFREIKRVIACMRLRAQGKKDEELVELLKFSLLNKNLKKIITEESSLVNIMQAVEKELLFESNKFEGLTVHMKKNELKIPEHKIFDTFFQNINNKHPVLIKYFQMQIDGINIVSLHRTFRWNEETTDFLTGGSIPKEVFFKIQASEDEKALENLTAKIFYADKKQFITETLENVILSGLLKAAKKFLHWYTNIGYILYYILLLQIETINTGLLLLSHKKDVDFLRKRLIV